ncbi:hypothetical protein [Spiroplasma endosymbiont of Atherix ibis]|uniref:hypothetical protein n=1 Tax=Spiroplasma endosymbiont of Atherix ibis TaxID=3066291 RepID=UPI0030CB33C8
MEAALKILEKYNFEQILKKLDLIFGKSLFKTIKYVIENNIELMYPNIFEILIKENYKTDYDNLKFNEDNFSFIDFYCICKYLSRKGINSFKKYERFFLKLNELRSLVKWIKNKNELNYIKDIFYLDSPDFIIQYRNKILGLEISSIYYQNTEEELKEYKTNLLLPIEKINDFAQKNEIKLLKNVNKSNIFTYISNIYTKPNLESFKKHIKQEKIDSYYNKIKNKYGQKNEIKLELFFDINEYDSEIHLSQLEIKKINYEIKSILGILQKKKNFKICIHYEYSDMLLYL